MNPYDILLNIIDQAIVDDNTDDLKENLPRLPFEKLNQSNLDLLLSRFINEAKSTIVIKYIFKIWYDYLEVQRGQLDHLTRLFTDITVSDDALQLVARSFDDKPAEYYFEHLIDYDSLPITIIAAKNIEKLFPIVNWEYLFEKSVEKELKDGRVNRLIKDFIENKLTETRQYTKKPKWIINEYEVIPYYKNLKNQFKLNYEKSLNLTIQEITDDEIISILGEDMLDDYLNSTDEEKKSLLRPHMLSIYRYSMNFDDNLFKVFGPVNTQLDEIKELNENHICNRYGGCRMLVCNEFEILYINDEEVDEIHDDKVDWFTGRCDQCFNPIKYQHYALREPLQTGGFIGCFCSFRCLRIDIPTNSIVSELIDIFEDQMNTIGIQDRRY